MLRDCLCVVILYAYAPSTDVTMCCGVSFSLLLMCLYKMLHAHMRCRCSSIRFCANLCLYAFWHIFICVWCVCVCVFRYRLCEICILICFPLGPGGCIRGFAWQYWPRLSFRAVCAPIFQSSVCTYLTQCPLLSTQLLWVSSAKLCHLSQALLCLLSQALLRRLVGLERQMSTATRSLLWTNGNTIAALIMYMTRCALRWFVSDVKLISRSPWKSK